MSYVGMCAAAAQLLRNCGVGVRNSEEYLISDYKSEKFWMPQHCKCSGAENRKPESDINHLLIYPNPVLSNSELVVESQDEIEAIQIFDLQGRLIKNITGISARQHLLSLSELNLRSGTYLLSVSANQINTTSKLVILE